MDVKTITIHYLQANGFDGLFTDECGCKLGDLFPCGFSGVECCKTGYLQAEPASGFDFLIGSQKPEISSNDNK